MRKVTKRFLVKYKLPPLEEADELFQLYQDFKQTFPTCLINEIQHYSFGKNDKTQLQLVYDPETQTLPDSHKKIFTDTVRFFGLEKPAQFRKWCFRRILGPDGRYQLQPIDSRAQIALENVRFRVDALAKKHKIQPITNKLPCQLKPCLDDVHELLRASGWFNFDRSTFAGNPYLAGRLVCRQLRSPVSVIMNGSRLSTNIDGSGWSPDDLIEFMHRLMPADMKSPSSYRLLAFVRHGPRKHELETALVKRLPSVDWKTVDSNISREIRSELTLATLGWKHGLSAATRPFAENVIADIDAAHPEPQDDLLE